MIKVKNISKPCFICSSSIGTREIEIVPESGFGLSITLCPKCRKKLAEKLIKDGDKK